jgi:hypothetical protein
MPTVRATLECPSGSTPGGFFNNADDGRNFSTHFWATELTDDMRLGHPHGPPILLHSVALEYLLATFAQLRAI